MRIVGNTVFKAFVWRQEHIAGVANGCAVNHEAVFERIKEIIIEGYTPYTVRVALHVQIVGQHLAVQYHLLGLRSLETECDTLRGIFWRDDGAGEQACHHISSELLFLSCLGRSRLSGFHRSLGCLLVE